MLILKKQKQFDLFYLFAWINLVAEYFFFYCNNVNAFNNRPINVDTELAYII